MTSPLHPYDPQTVSDGRNGRPSDSHPRQYRGGVVVTYCGPTDRRGAVWRGSIKRSATDRAITASVPSHDGPDAAAVAVLACRGGCYPPPVLTAGTGTLTPQNWPPVRGRPLLRASGPSLRCMRPGC